MLTAREARPGRPLVVHFWPGDPATLPGQAGAVMACNREPHPALASNVPAAVTCRVCLRSRRMRDWLREWNRVPSDDVRETVFKAWGWLRRDAPPPVPAPPLYRNPALSKRDPLAELVETWERLAVGGIVPAGGPLTFGERRVYASVAHELAERVATIRKGGW